MILRSDPFDPDFDPLMSARKQLEIADHRYRSGLVIYLEVASAQNLAMEHERAIARLRGQQFAAAVALIKSVGGGWQGFEQSQEQALAR